MTEHEREVAVTVVFWCVAGLVIVAIIAGCWKAVYK